VPGACGPVRGPDLIGSDRGCPRWATGKPVPIAHGDCHPLREPVLRSRGYEPFRVASPRHRDAAPERPRHSRVTPTGEPLGDRVIRLAINVPSHSESTARLHNVRSLLLCAGTACVVKAPDSKQLRPLRHNKSSISPQMIELKPPPTTVWRNGPEIGERKGGGKPGRSGQSRTQHGSGSHSVRAYARPSPCGGAAMARTRPLRPVRPSASIGHGSGTRRRPSYRSGKLAHQHEHPLVARRRASPPAGSSARCAPSWAASRWIW
jgi:hypothetical protein